MCWEWERLGSHDTQNEDDLSQPPLLPGAAMEWENWQSNSLVTSFQGRRTPSTFFAPPSCWMKCGHDGEGWGSHLWPKEKVVGWELTEQQDRSSGLWHSPATASVLDYSHLGYVQQRNILFPCLSCYFFWFFVTTTKIVSCLIFLFTQILANINSINKYCDRHFNQIIH